MARTVNPLFAGDVYREKVWVAGPQRLAPPTEHYPPLRPLELDAGHLTPHMHRQAVFVLVMEVEFARRIPCAIARRKHACTFHFNRSRQVMAACPLGPGPAGALPNR